MNPLFFVALAGVAALALGRKRAPKEETTKESPDMTDLPDPGRGQEPGGEREAEPGNGYVIRATRSPSTKLPEPSPVPLSFEGRPAPNTFYQVSEADLEFTGDPLQGIASMALYKSPLKNNAFVQQYMQCINAAQWNRYYYGVASDAPGSYKGLTVEDAFSQGNYDALAALKSKIWPEPTHEEEGAVSSSPSMRRSFGLLWLPPVKLKPKNPAFPATNLDLVCPSGSWSGGISGLMPPPALLASLSGPVPQWWQPYVPEPGSLRGA
jgi:hypothetical protein